jgi:adenosyl cobinamide kinase/adenosyl cobinamide phosphate guanylyltransferase
MLLGGARAGKSRLAVELAGAAGAPVTVLATAQARDPEMAERIASHRSERPREWETVEEPCELEEALSRIEETHIVIVDCLSLWTANVLERGDRPEVVLEAATRSAAAASARVSLTIAVSNEVGLGIVPATPLGRAYRDLLGSVNQRWVEGSTIAVLVVAGRALPLSDAASLLGAQPFEVGR